MSATTMINLKMNLDALHPEMTATMEASEHSPSGYDPTDPTKNFASGAVTENVISMTTSVIDSLGVTHIVMISFGKVDINKWAAEVYLKQNADNTYDVDLRSDQASGQLALGFMRFDGSGQLASVDNALFAPMIAAWNNGADNSFFTINWGSIGGLGRDGVPAESGVTQINIDHAAANLPLGDLTLDDHTQSQTSLGDITTKILAEHLSTTSDELS
jgi:hypothetical protein